MNLKYIHQQIFLQTFHENLALPGVDSILFCQLPAPKIKSQFSADGSYNSELYMVVIENFRNASFRVVHHAPMSLA